MQSVIKAVVKKTQLFNHLSPAELDLLCSQFMIAYYPANKIIIKEGDIGDQLYIILSGSVRVYTHNALGEEIVLARLEQDQYFGEQALLTPYPIKRNASVRTLTEVKTITLRHDDFQKYLKTSDELKILLKQYGQKQLTNKLIKQLEKNETDQQALMSMFHNKKIFQKREVFFWQNDASTEVYYILSGTVEIRFYDQSNQLKSKSLFTPGQFFGELGIIEKKPRTGTAVALTDCEVAVIGAGLFRELYQAHENFHDFMSSQFKLYQMPAVGLMTQSFGSVLGQPAVTTTVEKPNGDILVASSVVHSNIFSIYYLQQHQEKIQYFRRSDDHSRDILLQKNKLIGAISVGQWDDLGELYRMIYDKIAVTPEMLKSFHQSGRLGLQHKFIDSAQGNVCECMQIKYKKVQELILAGAIHVEDITKQTGAGSICGACRPRIESLLGGESWTFVKIIEIIEHNEDIHSYRLQPIDSDVLMYYPGQHIVIEGNIDGQWVARSYTLTSIDSDKQYYEITVKREKFGLFSRWLFANKHQGADQRLRISKPQGDFIFALDRSGALICLMAGIGITPAIACVRKLIVTHLDRPIYIDYSIHQLADLVFREEILNWPKQYHNITINVRVPAEHGRINEQQVAALFARYAHADTYICGPQKYEEYILSILNKQNIQKDHIHLERFTHAGGPISMVQ